MSDRIAAVIPAYNARAYIRDALDGVANQHRRVDEIVVVDDGSTDGTADHVRDWMERRGVAVTLVEQENAGPAAARNAGIRRATADLIALLDADDVWSPQHLATLEPAFKADQEVVLSFGDQHEFDEDGPVSATFLQGKAVHELNYEETDGGVRILQGSVYLSLLPGSYIPTSGSMFRREVAERIGLFDVSPDLVAREDREFLLRMSLAGRFAFTPVVVAKKRVHEENITHPRHSLRLQRNGLEVVFKMLSSAGELGLTDAEIRGTRAEAARHGRGFLYAASLDGPSTYLSACAHIARRGLVRPALDPKHLLRSFRVLARPSGEAA